MKATQPAILGMLALGAFIIWRTKKDVAMGRAHLRIPPSRMHYIEPNFGLRAAAPPPGITLAGLGI